jgi:hypothetical protein
MTTAFFQPSDHILQSFNALDKNMARQPDQILHYLSAYLAQPLSQGQIITQTSEQMFSGKYEEHTSTETTYQSFADSMGLKGGYGFYSGSISVNQTGHTYQSSTTYDAAYSATLDCGSCSYYQSGNIQSIRSCLTPELIHKLDAINSFDLARGFTNTYGTHLILGFQLGGTIFIRLSAQASNLDTQTSIQASANASYNEGICSVSAALSTTNSLSTQYQSQSFISTIKTLGGSATVAGQINPTDPSSCDGWVRSCTVNTVRGISETIEFWQLAKNSTAQNFLKNYVRSVIVAQSLKYPSYFSNSIPCQPNVQNTVGVTVPEHYKTISGGALVRFGSSSRLLSSQPNFDLNNKITGWMAASHDMFIPATPSSPCYDQITAYAIAIYDPQDQDQGLVQVQCFQAQGTNPGQGGDSAVATIDPGYTLTGGGVQVNCESGGAKYLIQCYPNTDTQWTGLVCDYENAAQQAPLTVYAIGVKPASNAYINISNTITPMLNPDVESGTTNAQSSSSIAGGGVNITARGGSINGNLVYATYPTSANTWSISHCDLDGNVCYADCTAYAIQLTAQVVDNNADAMQLTAQLVKNNAENLESVAAV